MGMDKVPFGVRKGTHFSFMNMLRVALCYSSFLLVEGSFVAFAWYCCARPCTLPWSSIEPATIRSTFVTIFILWHTIAIANAVVICIESFGEEYAARPKGADVVHTVSGGFIGRVFYFRRERATRTSKAAFLVFLGLLTTWITGSSTVTVTSGFQFDESSSPVQIAILSLTTNTTDIDSEVLLDRLDQANMVVRLEKLLGSPWGYVPQPNFFIPLPVESFGPASRVIYETDIVSFHYTCRWRAPDKFSDEVFTLDNEEWSGNIYTNATSAITNLSFARNGSSIVQLLPDSRNFTGTSIYLFLGGNTTIPVDSNNPNHTWIDLSGHPTVFNPDGFATFHPTSLALDWVRAPLATLLICNPNLKFMSGSVLLGPNADLTESDVIIHSMDGIESPHNIDRQAAQNLFTSILTSAIKLPDTGSPVPANGPINFNWVAAKMLLKIPSTRNQWRNASAIPTLDIESINRHIDEYTLSALKVFTSGYKGPEVDDHFVMGIDTTNVKARYASPKLILTTSVEFAIVHSCLFGILALMLAITVYLNRNRTIFGF